MSVNMVFRVTGKILLVVITDIGARHDLVFHTGNSVADILALYMQYVAQHGQVNDSHPRLRNPPSRLNHWVFRHSDRQ